MNRPLKIAIVTYSLSNGGAEKSASWDFPANFLPAPEKVLLLNHRPDGGSCVRDRKNRGRGNEEFFPGV